MSRETKYRGISKETGNAVYGSLVNNIYKLSATGEFIPYIFTTDNCEKCDMVLKCDNNEEFFGCDSAFVEVVPGTEAQFTGLKDCKRTEEFPEGQEIYEGDIVDFRRGERRLYIAFNSGQWNMCGDLKDPNADYRLLDHYIKHDGPIEKIGNIHDNPELLNATST